MVQHYGTTRRSGDVGMRVPCSRYSFRTKRSGIELGHRDGLQNRRHCLHRFESCPCHVLESTIEPGSQLPPRAGKGVRPRPLEAGVLMAGVVLVAAGAVAVFSTHNDAGTAALLAVGTVFVALAVVGDRIQTIRYRELEIKLAEQHAEHAERRADLAFRAAAELDSVGNTEEAPGSAPKRWRSSGSYGRSARATCRHEPPWRPGGDGRCGWRRTSSGRARKQAGSLPAPSRSPGCCRETTARESRPWRRWRRSRSFATSIACTGSSRSATARSSNTMRWE